MSVVPANDEHQVGSEYKRGGNDGKPPLPPGMNSTVGGRRRRTRRGKSGKRKGNMRRKSKMNRKKSRRH